MMDSDRGMQKVNVVLHSVAKKIKPPEETKRERWRLDVRRPRTVYWRYFFLSVNKALPQRRVLLRDHSAS